MQKIAVFRRYVLASAIRELNKTKEITEAPNDCDNSGANWETGRELFNTIRKQVLLNGMTGKVAFDDQGDRINAEYNLVNVQKRGQIIVGKYYFNRHGENQMHLTVNEKKIVWPGRVNVKPEGFLIPTHLKVLTVEEIPFVYVRKVQSERQCMSDEIPCPRSMLNNIGKLTQLFQKKIRIFDFEIIFEKIRSQYALLQRILYGFVKTFSYQN